MGRVTRNTIRGGSESLVESVASPDKIGKKARTRKSPSLLGSVDTSADPAPPAAANAKSKPLPKPKAKSKAKANTKKKQQQQQQINKEQAPSERIEAPEAAQATQDHSEVAEAVQEYSEPLQYDMSDARFGDDDYIQTLTEATKDSIILQQQQTLTTLQAELAELKRSALQERARTNEDDLDALVKKRRTLRDHFTIDLPLQEALEARIRREVEAEYAAKLDAERQKLLQQSSPKASSGSQAGPGEASRSKTPPSTATSTIGKPNVDTPQPATFSWPISIIGSAKRIFSKATGSDVQTRIPATVQEENDEDLYSATPIKASTPARGLKRRQSATVPYDSAQRPSKRRHMFTGSDTSSDNERPVNSGELSQPGNGASSSASHASAANAAVEPIYTNGNDNIAPSPMIDASHPATSSSTVTPLKPTTPSNAVLNANTPAAALNANTPAAAAATDPVPRRRRSVKQAVRDRIRASQQASLHHRTILPWEDRNNLSHAWAYEKPTPGSDIIVAHEWVVFDDFGPLMPDWMKEQSQEDKENINHYNTIKEGAEKIKKVHRPNDMPQSTPIVTKKSSSSSAPPKPREPNADKRAEQAAANLAMAEQRKVLREKAAQLAKEQLEAEQALKALDDEEQRAQQTGHKRKRVRIDDLVAIPSRRTADSSGTFALLPEFFDTDDDEFAEISEVADEEEEIVAPASKKTRFEESVYRQREQAQRFAPKTPSKLNQVSRMSTPASSIKNTPGFTAAVDVPINMLDASPYSPPGPSPIPDAPVATEPAKTVQLSKSSIGPSSSLDQNTSSATKAAKTIQPPKPSVEPFFSLDDYTPAATKAAKTVQPPKSSIGPSSSLDKHTPAATEAAETVQPPMGSVLHLYPVEDYTPAPSREAMQIHTPDPERLALYGSKRRAQAAKSATADTTATPVVASPQPISFDFPDTPGAVTSVVASPQPISFDFPDAPAVVSPVAVLPQPVSFDFLDAPSASPLPTTFGTTDEVAPPPPHSPVSFAFPDAPPAYVEPWIKAQLDEERKAPGYFEECGRAFAEAFELWKKEKGITA
ncbi:hypothetical protein LTR50_001768 [Elasticomyces elasticus]|nr:hypothetical protein LTR50_001768 [Elasticomyces elasticus]